MFPVLGQVTSDSLTNLIARYPQPFWPRHHLKMCLAIRAVARLALLLLWTMSETGSPYDKLRIAAANLASHQGHPARSGFTHHLFWS